MAIDIRYLLNAAGHKAVCTAFVLVYRLMFF